MKKFYNIIALAACAAFLSGCFGSGPQPSETSSAATSATSAPAVTSTSESPASAAVLASENEPEVRKEDKPLTIALKAVNKDYSPFDDTDECTSLLNKLTGVTLIGRTRAGNPVMSGKTPATEQYAGAVYAYPTIADTVPTYDAASDTTVYDITLREDVKFSDGETLDADDVIFTLYLHLDPSYSGSFPLHDTDIVGSLSYRYGSSEADSISKERITEVLASEEMRPIIKQRLMVPTLRTQYENIKTFYGDSAYSFYTSKYPTPSELFAYFYSIDSSYSAKGKDENTVISDVADMYGNDYRQLASVALGDDTYFDEQALNLAVGYITGGTSGADSVTTVSGIVKKSAYRLSVSVSGNGDAFEKALSGMIIVPLHYYGNPSLYRPESGTFGFIKGTADEICASHRNDPLGAGAFAVSGFVDDGIELTANDNFYVCKPASSAVKLVAVGNESPATVISEGIADICADSVRAESYKAVESANTSMEKIHPEVTADLGYGYIGINADNVKIGDQFSSASYALRKGIATAIAGYKDESLNAYFGGYDVSTDYPCLEKVTVDKTAEGYSVPFMTDVNGDPIYTEGMSEEARHTALKNACLGFFKAAGYTVAGGKVTKQPYGGKLAYTAVVAAGGVGDHPSFVALQKASELLSEIGITLSVTDITDIGALYESLNSGSNEIWAGAWNRETLREVYIDSCYGVEGSTKLKRYISEAEEASDEDKPAKFMVCYKKIVDEYAVEIPMYIRTSCTLFSSIRIDTGSLTPDMTENYDWSDEIYGIKQKR